MSRLVSIRTLKKLNYNGKVKENEDLSKLCTFRCGGKAKIFLEINTLENFLNTMLYFQKIKPEFFVLGAGSKILVSDKGYDGIVIKLGGDFSRISQITEDVFEFGAGVKLSEAFAYARSVGFGGLEDGVGIPATMGGAVFMNAGAYNFEMSKVVEYVVAYMDGKITYLTNKMCQFGYRSSIFQSKETIILRVGLKLEKKDVQLIDARFKEVMDRRHLSQPLKYPSAGSVFKRREDIVVSKLLDEYGLKGLTFGGAKVSDKHANFIINYNNATAQEIFELIDIAKIRFFKKSGILLETEIIFLGEFDEITR